MAAFSRLLASILAFFANLLHLRSTPAPPTPPKDDGADASDLEAAETAAHGDAAPRETLTAAEVFDSVGPAYEDAFTGLPTQAAALDWLVQRLRESPATAAGGARIVDVGCGTGRPACSVLADAGHDVLGIDISGAMLAAARARVPKAAFELIDVRAYIARETAAQTQLDAVTVFFSLIAGVSQADIRAVLAGLARLLKPGGYLVFSTVPIPVNNEKISWMGRPVVVSSLSPEDGVAAVQAAGLAVQYHAVTQFKPRGAEVGICKPEEVWEESHLFVYAQKPVEAC